MEVVIADEANTEMLIADIFDGHEYWCRVIFDQEDRCFKLLIFPPPTTEGYRFTLSAVQTALEQARKRLTELGYVEKTG